MAQAVKACIANAKPTLSSNSSTPQKPKIIAPSQIQLKMTA
jgi:hypothetical protein